MESLLSQEYSNVKVANFINVEVRILFLEYFFSYLANYAYYILIKNNIQIIENSDTATGKIHHPKYCIKNGFVTEITENNLLSC